MSWVESLKIYKQEKGGDFKIPRKGTSEYDEVREIQRKLKETRLAEKEKKIEVVVEPVGDVVQKVKRKYTKKNADKPKEIISTDIV